MTGLVLALAMSWTGGALAATPDGTAGTGVRIFGVVTDNELVPLEGVTVEIFEAGTTNLVAGTVTPADGTYSLNVAAGTYDLSYTPEPNSGFREVDLLATEVLEDLERDVVLVPLDLADVRWQFVDRDGTPIPNVSVQFENTDTSAIVVKVTDGDGVVSTVLRVGEYALRVRRGGNPGAAVTPGAYDLRGSLSIIEDMDRVIQLPNVLVDVTVLDPSDNPAPGVRVDPATTFNVNFELLPGVPLIGNVSDTVTTDAAGRAPLVLYPSTGRLRASSSSASGLPDVATDPLDTTADLAVVIRLPVPAVLSGTLLDRDGNPAFDDTVRLVKLPISTGRRTQEDDGSFSLPMVPDVYDQLRVERRQNLDEDPANLPKFFELWSRLPFELLADREEDISLPNIFLDVTVLDPDDNPVPDVDIQAACPTPVGFDILPDLPVSVRSLSDRRSTDAAGVARIVYFGCTRTRLVVRPPDGSGFPVQVEPDFELLADASITVRLVAPVRFSGAYRDRTGTPIANLRHLLILQPERVLVSDRTTDPTGAFDLILEPAVYSLQVLSNNSGDAALVPSSFNLFSQDPVDLTSDLMTDLVLPANVLEVKVVDPTGTPIPNTVTATSLVLGEFEVLSGVRLRGGNSSTDVTDASGDSTLVLFPLFPGRTFDLRVTPPDDSGFAAEVVSDLVLEADDAILVVLQFINQVPIAEAGPAQVVEATSAAGARAALDGTASSDPDDEPLTYEWTESGTVISSAPTADLQFALGSHQITLMVRDPQDAFDEDDLQIDIVDTTPPDTIITSAVGLGGGEIGDGSTTTSSEITFEFIGIDLVDIAGFDCSFSGAEFTSCADPLPFTDLPEGSYTFAVRAFDSAGNVDPTPATYLWTVARGPVMPEIPTQSTWGLLALAALLAWTAGRRVRGVGRGR